jgi:hypothetical protein
MSRNPEKKNQENRKSGKKEILNRQNPEKKKFGKEKSGKVLKHVDTFISFSVSFHRDQRNNYLYSLSALSLR